MGLAFRLTLPADTQFVRVGYIPELTASAIYPLSDSGLEIHDGGLDLQEFKNTVCQTQHESALNKAIDAGMVTPLNSLSYEAHTFPFGEARKNAVITIDDFKRFAETLQIEVVIEPPAFWLASNDSAGTKAYLTIDEAASAIAKKYGLNTPTTDTMREQLSAAADNGELTVRHPHTLLPYRPDIRRNFYELVSVTDLNAWLKKQGAEYQLDEVLTRDTLKPSLTIDDVTYSKTGLTIFDATEALAEKYALNKPAKENLLERLLEAAHRGELVVRDSLGFPYTPLHAEKHYYIPELVSADDLNAWLEKQRVEYRLDRPEQAAYVETTHIGYSINRNEVMAAFTVKANSDENRKFWDDKLGRPPVWLKDARINSGKPGTSALWNPLLLAHSLLGTSHMSLGKLDDVMNECFPELVELWNEETSDKR